MSMDEDTLFWKKECEKLKEELSKCAFHQAFEESDEDNTKLREALKCSRNELQRIQEIVSDIDVAIIQSVVDRCNFALGEE